MGDHRRFLSRRVTGSKWCFPEGLPGRSSEKDTGKALRAVYEAAAVVQERGSEA